MVHSLSPGFPNSIYSNCNNFGSGPQASYRPHPGHTKDTEDTSRTNIDYTRTNIDYTKTNIDYTRTPIGNNLETPRTH